MSIFFSGILGYQKAPSLNPSPLDGGGKVVCVWGGSYLVVFEFPAKLE
jgi:hypothetical protein